MESKWAGLLKEAGLLEIRGELPPEIPFPICTDSRQAIPGALFIALPGTRVNGESFIPQALKAGASLIIHSREMPGEPFGVPSIRLSDPRAAASLLHRAHCGFPDRELSLFGVTGTNGKTTSVYLFRTLLERCKKTCGLVSTVEYHDGEKSFVPTHTTPDPETFYPLLERMVKHHLPWAAMEFSSHSLAQNRLAGVRVRTAVFTHLSGDHLDFHKDMEHYFEAKQRLFLEYLLPGGNAVINADTPWGEQLCSILAEKRADLQIASFGMSHKAAWRIEEAFADADGGRFRLFVPGKGSFSFASSLPGYYNIHNLAGVLVSLLLAGLSPEELQQALEKPVRVPGRLELLRAPNGARFYVDYAHTDDALANVLQTLKPCTKGKLIVLFGAGGERDRSKRPRMGSAAARFADLLIVTGDNSRSEKTETIMEEILAGVPAGKAVIAEADRRKAIRRAAAAAEKEDIVLVAGKGHEDYQIMQGVRSHFDDREEIAAAFQFQGEKGK